MPIPFPKSGQKILKNTWIFQGFCCKLSIFLVLRFRNSFFESFFQGLFSIRFYLGRHTHTHTHWRDMRQQLSVSLAFHLQILICFPTCALSLMASSIFNNICFKFLFTLVLIIADCYCTSKHCPLKMKFSFKKT